MSETDGPTLRERLDDYKRQWEGAQAPDNSAKEQKAREAIAKHAQGTLEPLLFPRASVAVVRRSFPDAMQAAWNEPDDDAARNILFDAFSLWASPRTNDWREPGPPPVDHQGLASGWPRIASDREGRLRQVQARAHAGRWHGERDSKVATRWPGTGECLTVQSGHRFLRLMGR